MMLTLRAPAKLNLYLRVMGRRPDGYHEIDTLFERIDLADELTFEEHPRELRLTCTEPTLSCGENNLVLRAAELLRRTAGVSRGARIHLVKRIPIAAGLGGGSSDAAATLLGLNELWGLRLDGATLHELAATIGSDVLFFLTQEPFAVGRGRGEICEPIASPIRLSHVLVAPGVPLSTKEIYAGAQFDLTAPKPSSTMLVHALRNGSLGELAKGLWNDLEPEAIRRCPLIEPLQLRLRELGCLSVRVSGSGSAVFGLCSSVAHAQAIARRLAEIARTTAAHWRIEVVQTDHPVRGAAPVQATARHETA